MSTQMKQQIVKLSELCFYIFFVMLLFAKGIGLYDGQTGFKIFLIIALISWAGKMLLTPYTLQELLLYSLLVVLGGSIYLVSGDKGALLVIMLVCGLKNMYLKPVFKVGCVTWIFSFGTMFLLSSLHIVDSGFKVHDRLNMGRVIRWNLGYAHPNVLHISFFVLVCFLIYILQDRCRWYHLLLLEIGNLYVFLYSLSSTGFLITTICLSLVFYWNLRKKFCLFEQLLIQLCLPLCLFISFGAPLVLKGRAFEVLDSALNTRLTLSKWFLQNQDIKLLGVDTTSIVTSLRTMDNSYVFALITYGAVFSLLITVAYFCVIYLKTKKQDGIALCIILSCLIAGITEPFLFNTSFKNLSLLFIGIELSRSRKPSSSTLQILKNDIDIRLLFPDLDNVKQKFVLVIKRYRVALIMVSVVAAILTGIIIYQYTVIPNRYFLPRKAFEYTNDLEESYYFQAEDDIPQIGDEILGWESEQTEMVLICGNIAMLERIRITVIGGTIVGLIVFAIGSIILLNIWPRDDFKCH